MRRQIWIRFWSKRIHFSRFLTNKHGHIYLKNKEKKVSHIKKPPLRNEKETISKMGDTTLRLLSTALVSYLDNIQHSTSHLIGAGQMLVALNGMDISIALLGAEEDVTL